MSKYSIIIPVYNSGKWIKELVEQIVDVMENSLEQKYEIILINDSSPEKTTWDSLKDVCKTYSNTIIIDLQYNAGQLNALMCGFKHADGDYIITMDDDFQHNPYEIPKLVNKIKTGNYDCVIGNYIEKKHNIIRRIGSRISNKLSERIYNKPHGITSNSFRIINRKTIKALLEYRGKKPQIGPMIFSVTKKVGVVSIKHEKRAYGESGYKMRKLVSETVNVILNASTFPLDIVSIGGLIVAVGSFVIGLIYFILYIFDRISVPGFTAQILITTCLSGIIMLSIGCVGKYIGKIVQELIGFPAYIEKEIIKNCKVEVERSLHEKNNDIGSRDISTSPH